MKTYLENGVCDDNLPIIHRVGGAPLKFNELICLQYEYHGILSHNLHPINFKRCSYIKRVLNCLSGTVEILNK